MQLNLRKAALLCFSAAMLAFSAGAQSLDEGIKMVNYERYTTAEKTLEPLAAGNALANYYLGLAYLGEDRVDDAKKAFEKFPDDAANKAGLARVAFKNKNTTEAMAIATAVAGTAKKRNWEPLVYAADAINYGGGDAMQAIGYYEEAVKKGVDNVALRIGLGDAYLRINGGGGKAMDNYEKAVAMDPKNSLGYSRIGKLWYDARNYNDALTNYEKAKNADPSNPLPYNDLANAYFNVGKYELAKENIEEYLKLSDQSCDDKIRYANILFLAKDYDKAIAKMQEVIGSCASKPYMYRVLGYSQFETKDYTNALQNMNIFFQKQTDASKILPSDYMYMAKILGAQKKADSADFYYAKALAADTSSNKRQIYLDIAESYKTMSTDEGYKKAGEYYKKAIDADSTKASAADYFYWGLYAYYGKNYDTAATAFQVMANKFPDQPSASYWQGRVAAAVDNEGKTGAAVPFFQKWLSIPETEAYKRKPSDLLWAYQYMALVAYNKDDNAALKENIARIKEIEPTNALAKQLEDIIAKRGKQTKK